MASKKQNRRQEGAASGSEPVIRLEVSIPEARRALEDFAENRLAALDALSRGILAAVSDAFEQLLNLEMSIFLGRGDREGNKRNGHVVREYSLKGVGTFQVRVPRDRQGAFESAVIPASERVDPRLRQDLALLHLAGISSRSLESIAKRVLGMDVSHATILSSLQPLQAAAKAWLTRPLEGPYWALYIDATNFHTRRRSGVELEPSMVVVGVDATHHRSILAVEPGSREDVAAWRAAFTELKKRGLKASDVRIGVMDGLPGLEQAFREAFPKAQVARCWLHALKNSQAKAPASLRVPFKELADRVMYASSEDAARKSFAKLKSGMGDDGQRAVDCLEKDLDALLTHYRFERRFWHALKTTNAVERVHREIKRRTKTMDALGEGNLGVVIAFTALRLEAGWRHQKVDSRAIYNVATKSKQFIEPQDATNEAMDALACTA